MAAEPRRSGAAAAGEPQQLAHPLCGPGQAPKPETASSRHPGDRLQIRRGKELCPTCVPTPQPTEADSPSGNYFNLLPLPVKFHKTPITETVHFTHVYFFGDFVSWMIKMLHSATLFSKPRKANLVMLS